MITDEHLGSSLGRKIANEAKAQIRAVWAEAQAKRLLLAGLVVAITLLAIWMIPHDPKWVRAIIHGVGPEGTATAKAFSFYGDFPIGTVGLSAVIFLLGKQLRKTSFQRLAVGCVLAASLAGLAVNMVRSTAGRPRPMAAMEDGFYGPSLKYELHGFPSAHATTSMATAAVFLIPAPVLGVPMIALAAGVSWSRMHLWRHHPTDVTVGSFVGLLMGLGFGVVIRRRNQLELELGA